MKRVISFLLAVIMMLTCFAVGSSAKTGKKDLQFNSDGKFKIMLFADPQDDDDLEETTTAFMCEALDKYKPDFVIYLGDNAVAKGYDRQKKAITAVTKPVVDRGIPYGIVFGNHDGEQGVSKEDMLKIYQSLGDCRTVDAVPSMYGCGTCNVPVMSSDGKKTAFNLWLTDSGDYNRDEGASGYDYVHPDQIAWYKKTAAALAEKNGGQVVPSMNFQHIVIPEIYDKIHIEVPFSLGALTYNYFGKYYFRFPVFTRLNGYWLEECCPPSVYDGQLDAWTETGDVVAAFHGHDHNNSYNVNIDGVDIINVPTVGCSAYNKDVSRGAGLITLDENNPENYNYELIHFYDLALSEGSEILGCDGAKSKSHYIWTMIGDKIVTAIFFVVRFLGIDRL